MTKLVLFLLFVVTVGAFAFFFTFGFEGLMYEDHKLLPAICLSTALALVVTSVKIAKEFLAEL